MIGSFILATVIPRVHLQASSLKPCLVNTVVPYERRLILSQPHWLRKISIKCPPHSSLLKISLCTTLLQKTDKGVGQDLMKHF